MDLHQIVFVLVILSAFYWAFVQFSVIRRNIHLGKNLEIKDNTKIRWKNVLLVAFGQKKMFSRWIPAVFHLFIYVAFLFTQVELIEIIIDGLTGVHRFFAPILGVLYTVIISTIEVLSLLAFVATFIFLWRRNALKIPRFVKSEMKGWPTLDANIILIGEVVLIVGIFTMNGADMVIQGYGDEHYPPTGPLLISSWLGPAIFDGISLQNMILIERAGWWLHLITVLAFLNYLPSSKHLHIVLAFPNTWYAKLKPRGEMENMPEIMNEVKSMMGLTEVGEEVSEEIPEFGAKDVFGLSWKNIMDAYACTECGRCTAVCPANMTGKKLSPRKILMDIRDRADEIGRKIDSRKADFIAESVEDKSVLSKLNFDDGKSLFDYITKEELHACTTCNACVEACPVLIDPLEPILQMRRYEILTDSAGPQEWIPMFTSIENSGSVWQVPDERAQWTKRLEK